MYNQSISVTRQICYLLLILNALHFEAAVWQWCDSGTSSWTDPLLHKVHLFSTYALQGYLWRWHLLAILLWKSERMGNVRRNILSERLSSFRSNLFWIQQFLLISTISYSTGTFFKAPIIMIWENILYDLTWYIIIWHYYMIWRYVMWCDVMRCDEMWFNVMWCDMIWYDRI